VGGVALLVAAVGIANTMIMTILEHTREIGIMKAPGAEQATVRLLFLTEMGLIGVLAALAGNTILGQWLRSHGANQVGSLFLISPVLTGGAVVLALLISLVAGL